MRDVFPILTVTITNTKVMSELASWQCWLQNETILVNFIRIVRNKADSCCKSILSNNVSFNESWEYILRIIKFIIIIDWNSGLHDLSGSRRSRLELRVILSLAFLVLNLTDFWVRLRLTVIILKVKEVIDFLLLGWPVWVSDGFWLALLLRHHHHHH